MFKRSSNRRLEKSTSLLTCAFFLQSGGRVPPFLQSEGRVPPTERDLPRGDNEVTVHLRILDLDADSDPHGSVCFSPHDLDLHSIYVQTWIRNQYDITNIFFQLFQLQNQISI